MACSRDHRRSSQLVPLTPSRSRFSLGDVGGAKKNTPGPLGLPLARPRAIFVPSSATRDIPAAQLLPTLTA